MNYHEAAAIAKSNPGSVMTRNEEGEFIVRFDDGKTIESPTDIRTVIPHLFIRQLEEEISTLSRQVTELQNQLAKVSESEWARIAQEDERQKTEKMKKEREEYEARDEFAKRLARKWNDHTFSSDAFAVHATTDGQG